MLKSMYESVLEYLKAQIPASLQLRVLLPGAKFVIWNSAIENELEYQTGNLHVIFNVGGDGRPLHHDVLILSHHGSHKNVWCKTRILQMLLQIMVALTLTLAPRSPIHSVSWFVNS